MKNSLYVISGVTGMTGNELARQIIKRGQTVLGFDNFFASSLDTVSDILEHERFSFFEYDLNNKEQMNKIAHHVISHKKCYDDVIYINCAAVVHTEHFYHVNSTFDTNVTGMRSLLNQAVEVGASQFINCSTSEVYSMQSFSEEGGVREADYILLATAEHSQRTSYAAGKLMTEFFMKDAVELGLIKGCSIRFANVYSKNEKMSKHIIPYIIQNLYPYRTGQEKSGFPAHANNPKAGCGETILQHGVKLELLENSRENRRTFLHNYDSCTAVLALSDTESALDGSVYNVATEEEVSILELAKLIGDKLGIDSLDITFKRFRTADPKRRVLNTDKLRGATGWKPKVSLSEGLDLCISYLEETEKSH